MNKHAKQLYDEICSSLDPNGGMNTEDVQVAIICAIDAAVKEAIEAEGKKYRHVIAHVYEKECFWKNEFGRVCEEKKVAVKEEREACAKIADGHKISLDSQTEENDWGRNEAAVEIADAIRRRGQS